MVMTQSQFLEDYERTKEEVYNDYGTTEEDLNEFCEENIAGDPELVAIAEDL
jgi:hypothetical protein